MSDQWEKYMHIPEEDYSQAGQDIFVLSLFDKDYKGWFVDIGCFVPKFLNNTCRLEENGWKGISLDIRELNKFWEMRNTPFICADALKTNYLQLFDEHKLPEVIDYLSIDIDGNGTRFSALKKVFETNREFKVITMEHDSYQGFDESEKIPQRKFLKEKGYLLLCSDIYLTKGNPFEDWWINPKYLDENKYLHLKCENKHYTEIIKKIQS